MRKKEYKEEFFKIFSYEVEGCSDSEKVLLLKSYLFEFEKNLDREEINKGKSWTDEELRVIFSFAPNKENILKVAKAFKRGYGSIEQIYRWAATSDKDLMEKGRHEDKFVLQIKRVAKECGWRV
ncbi:hypothetical protein [Fictibacillus phosphorivorans]|uniref:hypothetical protein n=1 Tax=Fictibacillus phosphorivorans TaxID=1221500 RepID=UPI001293361D|nr:hypothetical protein [Fictibacillus phosphorivorans]MQR94193.1 hypothetical protein [Fictibacillus phosphorivorans]